MTRPRPIFLLLSSLLVAAPLPAQSAWTRVPRFPSQCYSDRDKFDADLQTASDAMEQAFVRQSDINAALKEKADNLDAGTRQSKMMAFLTSNPQRAQEVLGAMSGQGAAVAAAVGDSRLPALDEEYERLGAEYDAEVARVLGTIRDEFARQGDPASGATVAQIQATVRRYNAAYEALCNRWIIAGRFPAFLEKYRLYIVNEWLPAVEKPEVSGRVMLEILGIDASAYQSTRETVEVQRYMRFVAEVFGRRSEPLRYP
jgi:hypothetical protein